MQKKWVVLLAAALPLLTPATAGAWDAVGHQVVARIAWENMRPETRRAVVALLRSAPENAGLAQLLPDDARPLAERERELFLKASVWPDLVRDNPRYHRGDWHYVNLFWEARPSPDTCPIDRPDLLPVGGAVRRLEEFRETTDNATLSAGERAVQLAWILHIAGDIHQPLHASARITPEHPEGDRGGNLFPLAGTPRNLHSYWDGLLTRSYERRPGESEDEHVARIAAALQQEHPRSAFSARLNPGEFDAWAREGYVTAKSVAYTGIEPGQAPTDAYARRALAAAEPAAALAGYRLAQMLDRLFEK